MTFTNSQISFMCQVSAVTFTLGWCAGDVGWQWFAAGLIILIGGGVYYSNRHRKLSK